jgi:hypothetical protein
MEWFDSDESLQKLVENFECGTLKEHEWHHAEHLAICFWYLCRTTFIDAVFKMKLGILKYNERYQVQQTSNRGYHETITMFFVKLVHRYAKELDLTEGELVVHLRPFLEAHSNFLSVLWQYYSRPVLNSLEARIQWVEPDLLTLT